MASVVPISRPLSFIVNDLATTKARMACLDASLGDHAATAAEDEQWDALNSREHALEQEVRECVYALTGVSFDLLERVML